MKCRGCMDKMKKKKMGYKTVVTLSIVVDLIIFFSLFVANLIIRDYQIEHSFLIRADGIVSLFVLLLSFWQHYKLSGKVLNYNNVFLFFLYLFTFGQVLLYSFGVPVKSLSIFRVTELSEIFWASSFVLRCFIFFQIGSLLPYYKTNYSTSKDDLKCIDSTNSGIYASIRIIAILLFSVSIVPYFSWLFGRLSISISSGYGALYADQDSSSNILSYLSKMLIPSVFLLIYSINNVQLKRILKVALIIIAVINLIIGTRGDALTIIVILIVYNYSFEKKMSAKAFLKLSLVALAIMIIIPTVANFRSTTDKDFSGLSDSMNETLDGSGDNFVVKTVSELGYSLHPVILTRQIIPSRQDYRYGESYFSGLMMVLPSFLTGGYSFAPKAALDIWLQKTLDMPYGPGYSLFAEVYYNFGRGIGILFSLALGFFFSLMFNMHKRDRYNCILPILTLIFLYNSIIIARFPMHMTIRNIVYMYIIPYFLIKIIYEKRYKKR